MSEKDSKALWEPQSSSCPACLSSSIAPSFTIYYWRDFPLRFWECAECKACFANPMPSDALISRGNNALVKLYQRGRTFEHEFRDARQAYLRGKLLARKLMTWKRAGCLLEIGCYDGFFLSGIRDHSDWGVEGVEIADAPSAFARSRLGLTIHQGTLESLSIPDSSYDFILCHDLIEHINQPDEFLKRISRLLKPGGRLQVITPNATQDLAFARRADRAGTPLNMLLNHVIYYTPVALERAMARVGMKVSRSYCYDVRHAAKDFGWLGLNPPKNISREPGFDAVEGDGAVVDLRALWDDAKIAELKAHRKVSFGYGIWREILPAFFRLKVPGSVGLGHEIFMIAEKPGSE